MLKRILAGRGPCVPLLDKLGPHVLVVCLEVQFAPLEFEGSVSSLHSFLDLSLGVR